MSVLIKVRIKGDATVYRWKEFLTIYEQTKMLRAD
jgi:hypothetical protein